MICRKVFGRRMESVWFCSPKRFREDDRHKKICLVTEFISIPKHVFLDVSFFSNPGASRCSRRYHRHKIGSKIGSIAGNNVIHGKAFTCGILRSLASSSSRSVFLCFPSPSCSTCRFSFCLPFRVNHPQRFPSPGSAIGATSASSSGGLRKFAARYTRRTRWSR